MIRIGKPYITVEDDKAFLRARVSISPDTAEKYVEETKRLNGCNWLTDCDYPPKKWEAENSGLWFSVDRSYEDCLCSERSNAFVVALFWYAMVSGSDICFEAPMSKRLYEGIVGMLMPELKKNGWGPIRLSGPLTGEPVECEGGVVTGMTCGVDSFYTLHRYRDGKAGSGTPRLTHLSYCSGYCFYPRLTPPYDAEDVFRDQEKTLLWNLTRAKEIAAHNCLPLVHVSSNMDIDYYRGGIIYTGMYRYLACTISLERLCSVYISSSSGHKEHDMNASLYVPTQFYEDLLCRSLQTETFSYMTSDHVLRTEKLREISDDRDFQNYCHVCFNRHPGKKNCGECLGCWKTLIPLDIMGKLDAFSDSFDLSKYYSNREKTFRELIRFSRYEAAASARDIIYQILATAKKNPSESGDLFTEVYKKESFKWIRNRRYHNSG